MKRLALMGLGCVLLLAVVAYLMRGSILLRVIERTAQANLSTNLISEQPDGLHVLLCGAGSPLPDPKRSGPCTAVIAGKRLFVVDAGGGSARVMGNNVSIRLPLGQIEAILLTHHHSDHIDGLGEVVMQRWAQGGHSSPVPVFGPEGVEEVVDGINRAYRLSQGYRVAHHGDAIVPAAGAGAVARPFAEPKDGERHVIVDDGDLQVIAFRVDHEPVSPAVGYRFDYKGRSVLISGDTKKSANLERFAKNVDVLVHEALAAHMVEPLTGAARAAGQDRIATITLDILDYHTTPVEAAEIARDAGARHLVYNHIVPPLPIGPMEELFVRGVDDVYDGPVTIGRDGTFIRLPSGGDTIEVEELL